MKPSLSSVLVSVYPEGSVSCHLFKIQQNETLIDDITIVGMIIALKNYENNLYAFIAEHGLLKELKDYNKEIDMLAEGGKDRTIVVI